MIIKRAYYIFNNKKNITRGLHAHKELEQVLIAINGTCKILLDDGRCKKEILLNESSEGLFVKKMIWREMYDFSSDCILLVLASDFYKHEDYIRDYKEFLRFVK